MAVIARRLVLVCSLLVLVAAVGPAAAQEDASLPGESEPVDADEGRGPCLPVGLALAVLSSDGTVADILPGHEARSATDAGSRRIVLDGPGAVGACAEFQGYWGAQSAGTAASKLMLYRLGAGTGSSAEEPKLVDRDGLQEKRRGPSRHTARMVAFAKLDEAGKYRFVAEITVAATPVDSTAAGGRTVEERLRVPFVVEVREKAEIGRGGVAGFVYGVRDGKRHPIAGAIIRIAPAAAVSLRRSAGSSAGDLWQDSDLQADQEPRYALPALPGRARALGDKSVSRDWKPWAGTMEGRVAEARAAVTDEKGHYRIEAAPGAYVAMAKARGYQIQYFDGKKQRRDADRLSVEADKTLSGINFRLEASDGPKPPDKPVDPAHGAITGHVGSENSPDIKGAVVVAVPARRASDSEPGRELGARTDEHGVYRMRVPEGAYFVYAYAHGYARQWYLLQTSPEAADVVKVQAGSIRQGVDFRLVEGETPGDPGPPHPEGKGVIRGSVHGPEGPLVGAALVMALPPASDAPPREEPRPLLDEPAPGTEPDRPVARTDEEGNYELSVPVGKWVVRAEAGGFAPSYYRENEDSDAPTVFTVEAGDVYEDVDFKLDPVEATAITGQVTIRGSERPLAGALVWALSRPKPDAPGSEAEPPLQVRAITEEDGTYVLHVPAGTYAVGVVIRPEHSDPDRALLWWDNKRSLDEADLITLDEGEVVEKINFDIIADREVP